jgi:hypothetical protein
LIYADDINLLGDNTMKKNAETLNEVSDEFGLEVNAEKTTYMLLSRYQNAGQNYNTKTDNRSFKNVSQSKYFGTTITNHNLIQKEIKRRLNSGIACYHSAHNFLCSHLLSKNVKIIIYRTIILFVILDGVKLGL